MAIRFRCPNCKQLLAIASRKAGHVIECPACHAVHAVPRQDEPEESASLAGSTTPAGGASPSLQPSAQPGPEIQGAEPSPRAATQAPVENLVEPASGPAVSSPAPTESSDLHFEEDVDEGLTLRKAATEIGEMDLTPMVDVTFLLLIFFMITASFSIQKTLHFPPPEPEERGATQTIQNEQQLLSTSVEVEIDEQNIIYVDKERLANPENLVDTLLDRMRSGQKTELLLKVNAAAMHETVVKVVDAANDVGMQRIRLATVGASAPL